VRKLPPLTALRAFEAAARHLSFKAAADELGLTATAISHQIRLLEEILQRPLFRRRPRPLSLTDAGVSLFPAISAGFDSFAAALAKVTPETEQPPLRITTTNAFAGRWLVPRLPLWRQAQPGITLEVIGTDTVVDLDAGEADVAIRYAFAPPAMAGYELMRDRFWPVCSPKLVGSALPSPTPAAWARYPLVHAGWSTSDPHAPTWARWIAMARRLDPETMAVGEAGSLSFREELHAIEAVIDGQGIGLFSDVLIDRELAQGSLVRLSNLSLPGWGFYLVHLPHHQRQPLIDAFSEWIRSVTLS
jgi:LysR family transcriptional regulator, glycine cleavage system transcriptional activator